LAQGEQGETKMKIDYSIHNPHDQGGVSFGTIVMDDGSLVYLTQQAYLDGTFENPVYRAAAEDAEGNEYNVFWTPVENYMELEDESDCCDWDDFSVDKI
jgi:hypothetical protein